MNGKEKVTKHFISAIEMYSSLLEETAALVTFLLKIRLYEGAKLRLSQSYRSVESLVSDMRKHLSVKKSFTALQ